MGTVRIDCDDCGEKLVTKEHISVIRCEEVDGDAYRFECSDCEAVHVRPMETFHANVLIDAGFTLHVWNLPKAVEIDKSLPAITEQEAAKFALELSNESKLVQMLGE